MMENGNQEILLKRRSARACIRDGVLFYVTKFRQIFRQSWPIALGYALLSTIALSIPIFISKDLFCWGILMSVIAVALLLAGTRLRLHKRQIIHASGKVSFRSWISHLGAIILIAIVCLFVVSILTLFTSLPSIILMTANWQAQTGIENGDLVGMPEHVRWLSLATFIISGFIQAYIWISVLFPFHLLKASISRKEEEIKKYNISK